jgi:hypothetical protein
MTEKSNSVEELVTETYDPELNQEDFLNFTDLEGNPEKELAPSERNELFPSKFIKYKDKTVEIYHEKHGFLWAAQFVEGGQLPKALRSKWTTDQDAAQAVSIAAAKAEQE